MNLASMKDSSFPNYFKWIFCLLRIISSCSWSAESEENCW